jgi:hypothetical protein
MKRAILSVSILTLLTAGAGVLAGIENDRFKGGGFDGYDQLGIIQAAAVIPGIEVDRFKGGEFDGYDQLGIVQAAAVIPGIEIDRFKGGSYDGYDYDILFAPTPQLAGTTTIKFK